MKPCEVDAKRAHELITTLEEDGTCTLTSADGELVMANITSDTVVRALKLQEGNYDTSAMKLSQKERLTTFRMDKPGELTYLELKDERVKLALQIHQQYFHVYKPQKYTHPDAHLAYVFTNAIRQDRIIKGNWGNKILKDLKKAASTKSYLRTNYIGNGVILTRSKRKEESGYC